MPRLFTAIALPVDLREKLVSLQPPAGKGVRLSVSDQLHVTLQFLGEADMAAVSAALAAVKFSPFRIQLCGTGQFEGRDGSVTLWAGVEANEALYELQSSLTALLEPVGYVPEKRAYSPHVTLARCGAEVPREVIREFLTAHSVVQPGSWMAGGFELWSSTLGAGGPVYGVERVFPAGGWDRSGLI